MTEYSINDATKEELERRFTYHTPKDDQFERYDVLRDKARDMAYTIFALCPQSREQSIALTKLEEVVMAANAAIARRE